MRANKRRWIFVLQMGEGRRTATELNFGPKSKKTEKLEVNSFLRMSNHILLQNSRHNSDLTTERNLIFHFT
jgi:hypothetical protein